MPIKTRPRWNTYHETDFSKGIIRDLDRPYVPNGGAYDIADFLVHRPGKIFKRGGTAYAGAVTGGGSKILAVIYANFPTIGPKLVALADNFHVYTVAVSTADVGTISGTFGGMIDNPTLYVGGLHNFVVFPDFGGGTIPWYYDGNVVQQFGGGNIENTGNYTLTITGTPTGGQFKLAVQAQADPVLGGPGSGLDSGFSAITTALNHNASASDVQTALQNAALPAGAPTFACTGGSLPGTGVVITVPQGWAVSFVPPGLSGVSFTGGTSPKGTIGPVDGSAVGVPTGRFACTHLQRLLLANSYANQNRIWFGPILNPTHTVWDTANAWLDMDHTVSGLASLSNQLLVFSTRQMWRILGDTPPPDIGMQIEVVDQIGCTDARSIVVCESQCYWANPEGLFRTSGVGVEPLMRGRIESYWQGLFSGYDPSADGWTISAGVHGRRFIFLTLMNGTTTQVTLIYDIQNGSFVRMTNSPFKMYSTAYGASPELYAAGSTSARVYALSGLFTPASGNKSDANGTAVTPLLELRGLRATPGEKAFGHGWVDLDMRDAASDNPTLAVAVASGIEATTYGAVAESPLAETTDMTRKRFSINRDSEMVSVKLTQSNASSKTEIYGVRREERPYYPTSEGQ